MRTALKSDLQVYTVRFRPGEELKSGLLKFVKDNNLRAAFVMTCVGSVRKASLRMAPKDGKSKTVSQLTLFIPFLYVRACALRDI